MARSRRYRPVRGLTSCESEKEDKRLANGVLRAKSRSALAQCSDYDSLIMPCLRDASDEWTMGKDGRFRFDPKRDPDFMRK